MYIKTYTVLNGEHCHAPIRKKVKVRFHTALYPVRWTAQNSSLKASGFNKNYDIFTVVSYGDLREGCFYKLSQPRKYSARVCVCACARAFVHAYHLGYSCDVAHAYVHASSCMDACGYLHIAQADFFL